MKINRYQIFDADTFLEFDEVLIKSFVENSYLENFKMEEEIRTMRRGRRRRVGETMMKRYSKFRNKVTHFHD